MIKTENGVMTLAGSFQELSMEVSRILDIMAFKMSEDHKLNMSYDEAIEFLLDAADAARSDREQGVDGLHQDMSKQLSLKDNISEEDASAIGEIASKGMIKGWSLKKIDKKISKYLNSKGISRKADKSRIKTKKLKKKDSAQKKVDDLFNPKNFPHIKPQKFKKGE